MHLQVLFSDAAALSGSFRYLPIIPEIRAPSTIAVYRLSVNRKKTIIPPESFRCPCAMNPLSSNPISNDKRRYHHRRHGCFNEKSLKGRITSNPCKQRNLMVSHHQARSHRSRDSVKIWQSIKDSSKERNMFALVCSITSQHRFQSYDQFSKKIQKK
jgi:hypothetical protein